MNTIEHPVTPHQESRSHAAGRLRPRADSLDVFLLPVVMLTLLSMAAGIAFGFPAALENASMLASAPTVAQAHDRHLQPDEAEEEEGKPFVTDDVRPEGVMQASAVPQHDQ